VNTSVCLGIRAAEMTNLPPEVIQEAKAISAKISQKWLCYDS